MKNYRPYFLCQLWLFFCGSILSLNSQITTCIDVLPLSATTPGAQNGVYDFSTKWTNGSTIKVKYTGGSTFVRSKVTYYSKMWENYANIHFQYIESGTADILVSFEMGKGSWSHIGTNSKYFASQGQPSMNFGWFTDNSEEEEFKRTILHEFGHALGLLHEHKNPLGNIHWNLPVVYNFYQTQGWTKSQIDEQVLSKYSVDLSNHKYDALSIMHYPIEASFTTDGYSVGWNRDVSAGDKELIKEMYPKSNTVVITDPNVVTDDNPVTCALEDIQVEHNVYSNNLKGMKIYVSFTIANAQNATCRASAYFYNSDNSPLKDYNGAYNSTAGNVATGKDFIPAYPSTRFTKLEIFMPYDELEMQDGAHDLKFSVSIWSVNKKELIQSGTYNFTYTKGIICDDLEVLSEFDNQESQMFVMPRFTVKNARNVDCTACVYFYYEDGTPLASFSGDDLSFCNGFRPAYATTVYNSQYFSDLFLTVPYSAITIPQGTYNLKYFVALFNNGKQFATSDWYNMSFTR